MYFIKLVWLELFQQQEEEEVVTAAFDSGSRPLPLLSHLMARGIGNSYTTHNTNAAAMADAGACMPMAVGAALGDEGEGGGSFTGTSRNRK